MSDVIVVDESTDEQRLGRNFRRYRRAKKLTLRQMADELGCSINTIRYHEGGSRLLRVKEIWRAASILGVAANKLLDPKVEPLAQPASQPKRKPTRQRKKADAD